MPHHLKHEFESEGDFERVRIWRYFFHVLRVSVQNGRAFVIVISDDFPNPDGLIPGASGEQLTRSRPGDALHFVFVSFQSSVAFELA